MPRFRVEMEEKQKRKVVFEVEAKDEEAAVEMATTDETGPGVERVSDELLDIFDFTVTDVKEMTDAAHPEATA